MVHCKASMLVPPEGCVKFTKLPPSKVEINGVTVPSEFPLPSTPNLSGPVTVEFDVFDQSMVTLHSLI